MTLAIRRATLADTPTLARLRWDFAYESGRMRVQAFEEFAHDFGIFLTEALAGSMWAVWVAEQAGRLLGQLYMQRIRKVPLPGRPPTYYGYITNVYVVPERRSSGLGTHLLHNTLAEMRVMGLEFVILWPSETSVAWYLRNGFRPAGGALELRFEGS